MTGPDAGEVERVLRPFALNNCGCVPVCQCNSEASLRIWKEDAQQAISDALAALRTPAAGVEGEGGLAAELVALHEAARGCEFDLAPADGPIARLALFMHQHGSTIAATLAQPAPAVEEVERLREELAWYGEQARLARLIHSEGDAGRQALADDGGKRARAALSSESRS